MIEIKQVHSRKEKRQFIDFPFHLYAKECHWVPPLKLERKEFLSPKKNPVFLNLDAAFFLALKDDEVVGRISAQINHQHNQRYDEKTGHFGFFDCVDDIEVAEMLLKNAEAWLQQRGMKKIVGPFNLTINEESGVLIKGFEHKPYPFMPYNYPYYPSLLESCGFVKVKDLLAWDYDSTRPVPEVALQIAEAVKQYPGLVIRQINLKNLKQDMQVIRDVFNSAWSKNWGFIPWTEAELEKMVKDFKLILEPRLALIAEVNGEPAAISIAIPNYHESIYDLNGKLFPFGLFKFLYRQKIKKPKSARLALLGIKKEFRHDVLSGLSILLYTEMHRRSQELQHWGGELSWTLEDNEKINNGIRLMGGQPNKTYRIYQKLLS